MGVTSNFSREELEKRFKAFLDEVEAMQIEILQELGEMCVTHARTLPASIGFNDQTGNLRSSIGYAIFKDGVAIHSLYEKVDGTNADGKPLDGSHGVVVGAALAQSVADENPQGIMLVVTAGMNYALHVESKGRDVLTSAELLAERELPRMLDELVSNIKSAVE